MKHRRDCRIRTKQSVFRSSIRVRTIGGTFQSSNKMQPGAQQLRTDQLYTGALFQLIDRTGQTPDTNR